MDRHYKVIVRRRGDRDGYKLDCICTDPGDFACFKLVAVERLSRGQLKQERNKTHGVKVIRKWKVPYGVFTIGTNFCAYTRELEYTGTY